MHRHLLLPVLAMLLVACQQSPQAQADPASTPTATSPAVSNTRAPPRPAPSNSTAGAKDAQVDQQIDGLLGDHSAYRAVFRALQQAVAQRNAAAVAELISYPISLSVGGKPVVVKDRARFIALYDQAMTSAIAHAITGAHYADVMVSSQGVMLAQGQAWISGICADASCAHPQVKVIKLQPGPGAR